MKCPKCDFENPEQNRFCNKCATPLPEPEEGFSTTEMISPSRWSLTGKEIRETFWKRWKLIDGGFGPLFTLTAQADLKRQVNIMGSSTFPVDDRF